MMMTDADIQELEKRLWKTADDLRQGAGIKASQYAQPIFGLIFLRFADHKYRAIEPEILAEYKKRKGTLRERPRFNRLDPDRLHRTSADCLCCVGKF